jgi:hypothetical protein
MTDQSAQKPKMEEWLHWAGIIMERLTTCAHVYDKPPHEDIFMPEKNRNARKTKIIEILQRIHALADEVHTPSDTVANANHHDEQIVPGLAALFQEVLQNLPSWSTDMQKLMKSRWDNHCNGRIASELFRGRESEKEGIGTGMPEHGRLPEVLFNLLDREQAGDGRPARQELEQNGESHLANDEPQRHSDEPRRRAERHGSLLRSAGRVD